jgi:ribosomal protein L4
LDIEAPKTKVLAGSLKPFANADKKKTAMSILLIPNAGNTILPRAGANLPRVKVVSPNSLNPHDLLKYQQIFIDQRAVSVFEEKVAK